MVAPDPVLVMHARLTDRDVVLLDWLADHEVLTTTQIAAALFATPRLAQRRLVDLVGMGAVERFRPGCAYGQGSIPWRYVLGYRGAQWIAARREMPTPRPLVHAERARRIATGPATVHRLGVNQFFVDLAATARRSAAPTPGPSTSGPVRGIGVSGEARAELERWWSERECAQPGAFGLGVMSSVRPDGHGIWVQEGVRVAFYLEYDTGTETHRVLADKLAGYARHVARGGPAWPLLFSFGSPGRAARFHASLEHYAETEQPLRLPVATTVREPPDAGVREGVAGPADAVWWVHGTDGTPRRLIDLAGLGDPAPQR